MAGDILCQLRAGYPSKIDVDLSESPNLLKNSSFLNAKTTTSEVFLPDNSETTEVGLGEGGTGDGGMSCGFVLPEPCEWKGTGDREAPQEMITKLQVF